MMDQKILNRITTLEIAIVALISRLPDKDAALKDMLLTAIEKGKD